MEPWMVEKRFRLSAWLLTALLCSILAVYGSMLFLGILYGPEELVQTLLTPDQWGKLPNIRFCHGHYPGGDYPVKWGFERAYINPSGAWGDTHGPVEQAIEAKIVRHPTVLKFTGEGGSCMLLESSVLSPDFGGSDTDNPWKKDVNLIYIAFSVENFEPSFDFTQPNLVIEAVGAQGGISFLGYTTVPEQYVEGNRRVAQRMVSLKKTIEVYSNGTRAETYAAALYDAPRTLPGLYDAPLRRPECANDVLPGQMSDITEPYSHSFGLITLVVQIPEATVAVLTHLSRLSRICYAGGGIAGYFTFIALIFTKIFPKRYPRSMVAVTYDSRTLVGFISEGAEPSQDGIRELLTV